MEAFEGDVAVAVCHAAAVEILVAFVVDAPGNVVVAADGVVVAAGNVAVVVDVVADKVRLAAAQIAAAEADDEADKDPEVDIVPDAFDVVVVAAVVGVDVADAMLDFAALACACVGAVAEDLAAAVEMAAVDAVAVASFVRVDEEVAAVEREVGAVDA